MCRFTHVQLLGEVAEDFFPCIVTILLTVLWAMALIRSVENTQTSIIGVNKMINFSLEKKKGRWIEKETVDKICLICFRSFQYIFCLPFFFVTYFLVFKCQTHSKHQYIWSIPAKISNSLFVLIRTILCIYYITYI